ncbi:MULTISPECIES: hypothetical protein [Bacteroides]|nr:MULTISPECIES: hypothetical protein [Bacteroides]
MTNVVNWTLISAFSSIIPALGDWDASFLSYFYGYIATYYGLFFYYLLRTWKVSPNAFMKIVTVFCFIWVTIEIGQQFTYPEYWFLGRQNEWNIVENRMGLWRFYIWGIDFVMLAFAFYAGKVLSSEQYSKVDIIYFIIFTVGILCYCSRKHIVAVVVVITYAILTIESKHKWKIRIICLVVMAILFYSFYEDYLAVSAEADDLQGAGEDFIRYLAAKYFIVDFSNSPLYPIFGTGWGSLALGNKLEYCKHVLHFYISDVGIIGYYSTVGLVGVSAIIFYIYKFIRNWKYIDLGYKMFFIMKMILVVFDFWMCWAIGIIAYGTFLYLLDENIKENKLIKSKL